MTAYNIFKETSLPANLQPNSIYLVTSSDVKYVEMYVTSSDGSVVRRTPKKEDIESLISSAIAQSSKIVTVANITERDALTSSPNMQVMVLDATADGTVNSGAAIYIYIQETTSWTKIHETESLDVVLDYNNLTNKPTSSVANIDDAVAKKHAHTNQTQLDQIGEDSQGSMTYKNISLVKTGSIGW